MALDFDVGVSRLVARVAGVRCVSAGSGLGGRTMQARCGRTRLLMRRGPRRTRCASSLAAAPFHGTHRPTRSRLVDEATAPAWLRAALPVDRGPVSVHWNPMGALFRHGRGRVSGMVGSFSRGGRLMLLRFGRHGVGSIWFLPTSNAPRGACHAIVLRFHEVKSFRIKGRLCYPQGLMDGGDVVPILCPGRCHVRRRTRH